MSYQATYTTSINPRIASDALKNIGRNFLQISESIRVGSEKCTAAMDSLMNKQNGFLTEPDVEKIYFKINEILSDKELFNKIGNSGQITAKKFDWNIVTQKYIKIYESARAS